MKIREVDPSCPMRTDGRTERRTDMPKLIFAFRSFANAPLSIVYSETVWKDVCWIQLAADADQSRALVKMVRKR